MATKKKNTKIYDASEVAKFFVHLASKIIGDNDEREGITNLKLQKILYLAQAYYLSKFNKPLFSNTIEAWEYGPVVPDIYHVYKKGGNKSFITKSDTSLIDDKDKVILSTVWDTFGGYSAGRLVNITHAHAPWKDARASGKTLISNKSIADYYTPLLNK